MLGAELDNYLGYKSSYGKIPIDVPQDREGDFEPKIVPKRKKDISEIEQKIISLYAKGLSTRQISEVIDDIYGFEVSDGMVSDITDNFMPKIEEWQNRALSEIYPIVFIDCIHFSVRDEHIVKKLAAYIILGINSDGHKEVLSISVGENESAKYWLGVLTPMFKFSAEVRKVIYTTNAIESLNSAYRRLNSQRSVFPTAASLMKALYLATYEATRKWTMPLRNWGRVYGELSIMYEGRLPE